MILARTLYEKLRPRRLSPRDIQEQLDVSRTVALTMAYAKRASGIRGADDDVGMVGLDRKQFEEEANALSPKDAKDRVKRALNDQVVSYFRIVDEVHNLQPPRNTGAGYALPQSKKGIVTRQHGQTEGEAIEKAALEAWRNDKLGEVLRERLGFRPRIGESTIPGAGDGLFVEGSAPEGAIVAIYPGLVHLPENLQHQDYKDALLPDDNFFLMGRADGCVIDGRTRDQLPSSPLTLAHAVNHPPEGRAANVLQAAYDYPSKCTGGGGGIFGGGSKDSLYLPENLRRFIPNRYGVVPKLFGGKVDRFALAETVVLVACRGGLHDEEVFMDYRFNPKLKAPDWYTPVNPKETEMMWASEESTGNEISELVKTKNHDE